MKLIDRDKFIGDMFDFYIENRWSPRDIHFSLLDVRSNIDSPEFEVKASPIEWIKEWVERDENYWDYQYLTDVLLKDWEKENATEITD